MTGFAFGPPAPSSAEFAAFLALHHVEPCTVAEVDYWRIVLWFLQLGGDPARVAVAVEVHQVAREAAELIKRARRGA